MPTTVPRRWATVSETAEYLHVSSKTVRAMIMDGRLPAYSSGRRLIRLDLNEVDAAMQPFTGAVPS